jgi:predicted PurR-regulated permease PerM
MPRSAGGVHSSTNPFSPSTPVTPRDGGLIGDKPQKSKSFMSSLKHLTLPRRKHNKNKHENNMSSTASSITQLNTSMQSPQSNLVSHSLSSGEIHISFVLFSISFFNYKHLIQLYQDQIPVCV